MAIGWLAVLQSVPWGDVIANAPKVAEGARKLWATVARKDAPAPLPDAADAPAAPAEPEAVAALRSQVASLEAAVAELHAQMLASSGLIKDLAEQNAQLIARVDAGRRRMRWLAGVAALAVVLALVGLGLLVSLRLA